MPPRRRIIFVVYDGFEVLDFAGPMGVFSTASRIASDEDAYGLVTASPGGGPVVSGENVSVETTATGSLHIDAKDTLIVVGAYDTALQRTMADKNLSRWLSENSDRAGRTASICSGAFVLGAAGLIENKRVTTHWIATSRLAKLFPKARVEPDSLFVSDGRVWTSAGVTTGIDMALEMVRRDLGAQIASETAQRLVMFAHRPGNQSQFSRIAAAQATSDDRLRDLIVWVGSNLNETLSVAALAERAGMSERNFHRRFVQETGQSPGAFLSEVRLERARDLLSAGQAVGVTAFAVGYRSEAAFRSAFEQRYGVSPSTFSTLHSSPRTYKH